MPVCQIGKELNVSEVYVGSIPTTGLMKTESTSSKWRAGPSGKGDRSRVTDKTQYDNNYEQAFGKRPCPLEERDLSWVHEEEQEGNTDE